MPTELQQIQDFFKSYHIPLSTEWVESCIEWCKDGNLPPNYTLKDIQKMVYEQWLVLDLRDIEVTSLPRNISSEKKWCLTGSYCLQMMQVMDISKPKLWQLQRIRNKVAKNTEVEKDFGKRVLQLTLTDGVQEVEAMEFKPIQCLNINLLPGTKIRIIGPVMVRNGRLMIKEENVKVSYDRARVNLGHLGGSVDDIRVQYAAENILARALRLEENPNPFTIDENALEVSNADTTTQANRTTNAQYNNSSTANHNRNQNQNYQAQPRNNSITSQGITRTNPNFSNSNSTKSKDIDIPPEFQVDDELLRELEADFEDYPTRNTIPRTSTQIPNTNSISVNSRTYSKATGNDRSRECYSPDLFEDMEMAVDEELLNDHLDQLDQIDNMTSNTKSSRNSDMTRRIDSNIKTEFTRTDNNMRVNKSTKVVQDFEISSSSISKAKTYVDDEEVITLDDSFDDIDIDSHLDNIDEEMAKLPSSTQRRNDIKDRLGSPELKLSKRICSDSAAASLSLKKPLASFKKLTQGTLNFGPSKKQGLNLPAALDLNPLGAGEDDPFSIFKKAPQKLGSYLVDSFKPPQKAPSISSLEFESKNVPMPTPILPQKSLVFELPSTSSSLPNLPQNSLETTLTSPNSSSKISNVLSIEKLKKMLPNIGKGKFKIKGKFKRVAEKLQQNGSRYYFVIVVEDDTDDLTVQIHSNLVTSMAGMAPEELSRLKVFVLQQDEDVKRQILQVLGSIHRRCLKLDDILEIQVTRGEKYPVVTNIL